MATYGQYNEPEEDDDLGYYPDGVKRTLTDDQIAIFRHSEVYSIVRKRQLLKESEEADLDERSEGEVSAVDDGNTNGAFSERVPAPPRIRKDTNAATTSVNPRTKRKRPAYSDVDDGYEREHPSRRIIRELDDVKVDVEVLDYGGEPSVATDTLEPRSQPAAVLPASKLSSAGPAHAPISGQPAKEGKKIWWPSLEP